MKWSSTVRKWSRLIHRDLSFFFSGMVLIYAISGIVMNHRDTINPNFSITRKEYKIAEKLPDKAGMSKEKVLTLLEPLGETGNYTKYYFPKTDVMKVFLKGGSSLLVNVKTGEAVYESVTRRPLIGAMSRLHYNPGQSPPNVCATNWSSCCCPIARAPASKRWSIPVLPTSYCRKFPRCSWKSTSTIAIRTCSNTP